METVLPPGFTAGPLTDDTAQAAVSTINAYWRWMNGGDFTSLEEISAEWQSEGFHRETDTRIVCAPDGTVAGYADLWDTHAPHVRLDSLAAVHPDYFGKGIGAYLLDWIIARARRNVCKAPEGARVVLEQGTNCNNQAACSLFAQRGFHAARYSYQMRIDLCQPLAAPVILDGIIIRSIEPGEERAVLQVIFDSFRDHWGWVERPFEAFYEEQMYYAKNDPHHDPGLWMVAVDGDEVAGAAICAAQVPEDPEMGFVNALGVRRPWRKRGIGLALLQHAFRAFQKRGKPRAGLSVDADSLTGATRLYEKAGMRVFRRDATYELELRSGVNLETQTIEAED